MRLLLVCQHYPPHFEGGTEVVARAQAVELAALGHEVSIVAGSDRPRRGEDVEEARVDGLAVRFVPRKPEEPYDLGLERPRVAALVRDLASGADLVHVHHWSTLHGALVRELAERAPVALTLHDHFAVCPRFFRTPPPSAAAAGVVCPPRGDLAPCARCVAPDAGGLGAEELAAGLARRAERFEAEVRAASALFAPSRSLALRLEELLALERGAIAVLPHGLCRALPRASAAPWDGRAPLRCLHFGHRSEVKGALDLARALALLPAGSVELVVAGEEVEAGFDRRLAAAAPELPIRFHGAYDLALLARLAADSHVAAFPSRARESYGLVVDEALALGLPAWVSDRGALPERIGAAGRVLPAEEPARWAEAFREVLADPGALARERAAIPAALPTAREAARALDRTYRTLLSR